MNETMRTLKTMMMAVALFAITATADAMSYTKAREYALFLTDKMAYELALYDDQYSACYEINLDYIMCIDSYSDIMGYYWQRRNTELSYVLTSAQYAQFIASEYFYRPVSYVGNRYVWSIYNRYPRNRYYMAAPNVYKTYRGGNRFYHDSPYKGRVFGGDRPAIPGKVGAGRKGNNPYVGHQPNNQPNVQHNQGMGSNRGNASRSTNNNASNAQRPTMTRREAVNQSEQNNRTMMQQQRTSATSSRSATTTNRAASGTSRGSGAGRR